MLLSMRRAGEPDAKRIKYDSAGSETDTESNAILDDAILQRFSVCSVDANKPSKKRAYVRQFGVTEKRLGESEYVDISQVQQLLFESAASGKAANDRNRNAESQDPIDRQDRDQSAKKTTPHKSLPRPHSQPSCSSDLYRQGRQIEYFTKGDSPKILAADGKGRMLPEGFPNSPLLQTPPFSAGGHSPNVEELFSLWFGVPNGNAGEPFALSPLPSSLPPSSHSNKNKQTCAIHVLASRLFTSTVTLTQNFAMLQLSYLPTKLPNDYLETNTLLVFIPCVIIIQILCLSQLSMREIVE